MSSKNRSEKDRQKRNNRNVRILLLIYWLVKVALGGNPVKEGANVMMLNARSKHDVRKKHKAASKKISKR